MNWHELIVLAFCAVGIAVSAYYAMGIDEWEPEHEPQPSMWDWLEERHGRG